MTADNAQPRDSGQKEYPAIIIWKNLSSMVDVGAGRMATMPPRKMVHIKKIKTREEEEKKMTRTNESVQVTAVSTLCIRVHHSPTKRPTFTNDFLMNDFFFIRRYFVGA